jgi:uncharacterized protein YkwD
LTTYHVRAGDTVIVDPEPVTPPPPPPPAPDPFTVSDAAFSAAMVAEVNKRRAAGWTGKLADGTASTLPPVGPLLADPDLFKAAVASVTDSAQTRTSVHKDWITPNVGTRTHTASGEVIGEDKGYPEATTFFVDAWMKSDGHRAILMTARYDSAGFAYSRLSDDQVYFAGEFADFSAIPTPLPPVIVPVPTTTPFLSRPISSRIGKDGGTSVTIENVTIRGGTLTAPYGIGITVRNVTGTVTIRDVDLADLIGGIYLYNCSGTLIVENVRGRNIGDGTIGAGHSNHLQLAECSFSGGIRNNRFLGGRTEDMLSIWHSGGKGVGSELVVEGNHLQGLVADTPTARAWTSGSGTGIIISDGAGSAHNGYVIVRNNTLLTPGQVGIQHIDGPGLQTYGNVIYGQKRPGNNNPMTSWEGNPRGVVRDNRYLWTNDDLSQPTPWFSGYGSLSVSNNVKDATLDPKALEVVL